MHADNSKHNWHLENTYSSLPKGLFSLQAPVPVVQPQMLCFNEQLATDLGLGFLAEDLAKSASYFSGNELPPNATPLAQAYAGHQFGHFNRLGDGRAVLLGERLNPEGKRFDIQLKGSGPTPYSRRGDGRATLYSMLREYLISEAMYHLGIPTTRSLCVVSTGEEVVREEMYDGAVLTRIAASHIRVGTFEYVRNFCAPEDLKALMTYTIERHYPELAALENPALELLKHVMYKQIDLIVDWMRVGFIHGVMNTDNMSIAGETIDYGPCAFMNTYKPGTVFSSIDTQGRYAFGNQPYIAQWNIAIFANALLPLIAENQEKAVDLAKGVIEAFRDRFEERWYTMQLAKLGIWQAQEKDKTLVDELLALMEKNSADYTQVFLTLAEEKNAGSPLFESAAFNDWKQKWKDTYLREARQEPDVALMKKYNPSLIPRNHWVEEALGHAVEGDLTPFNELMEQLSKPYQQHQDTLQFEQLPEGFDNNYRTFCGT